jgi:hypothetical protein
LPPGFSVMSADRVDLRAAQRVHHLHDRAVRRFLVALEVDDLSSCPRVVV